MTRYAVIGLGRFGRTLALQLVEGGAEVIAVDINADLVEELRERLEHVVELNATSEVALRRQGVESADVGVVTIGEDFEASVLTTMLLKKLGVARIITRAVSELQERVIRMLEVEVIAPERDTAKLLALQLLRPGLVDNIALADGLSLVEYAAPSHWVDRSLRDLDLRGRFGANVIAVKRVVDDRDANMQSLESGVVTSSQPEAEPAVLTSAGSGLGERRAIAVVPGPEDGIRDGDVLLIVVRDEDRDRLLGEA